MYPEVDFIMLKSWAQNHLCSTPSFYTSKSVGKALCRVSELGIESVSVFMKSTPDFRSKLIIKKDFQGRRFILDNGEEGLFKKIVLI